MSRLSAIFLVFLAACTSQAPIKQAAPELALGVQQVDRAGRLVFEYCTDCPEPTPKTLVASTPARLVPPGAKPIFVPALANTAPEIAAVFFKRKSSIISPADGAILHRIVERVKDNKKARFVVVKGGASRLALRRANAVVKYLILSGIPSAGIEINSEGLHPISEIGMMRTNRPSKKALRQRVDVMLFIPSIPK